MVQVLLSDAMQALKLIALSCLLWMPVAGWSTSNVVQTQQLSAQLIVDAPEGVKPGATVWLGLLLQHQPHWHTYWKNSGDSGLPTQLQWTLPEGVQAAPTEWPKPKRLRAGPLANYGYDGTVLLPVPATVSRNFRGKTLDVSLQADWLVCKESCIPQSGSFKLSIPVDAASTEHHAMFEDALARRPIAHDGGNVSAVVEGETLVLEVQGLPPHYQNKPIEFYSETPDTVDHAADAVTRWVGGTLKLQIPLSKQRIDSPKQMDAVIASADDIAGRILHFPVSWNSALTGAVGSTPSASSAASTSAGSSPTSIWLILGMAFAGGLLLNLMPCVFPILSLKVLGFSQRITQRRELVQGGVAYTAGATLSFVGLAGLLLALRAGGESLGWGFQLQSPAVIAVLATLFTLIAANLFGVFEVGSVLPSWLASMRASSPALDHGLTGVLAVAVASPCTAPFMGVALGAALVLPAWQALTVFLFLGLGMAAPYLLATLWPAAGRLLPRPGAWMAKFKILMAFPMLATVVWLVWVFGQQTGVDGAAALLGSLVAASFAAWTIGTRDWSRRVGWLFRALALIMLMLAAAWTWRQANRVAQGAPSSEAAAHGAVWQPWSQEAVVNAQKAGRPVFVDFTAAWCVTCQFNKRTTLNDVALVADMARRNVLLLRADWTSRDPAITQELARLGRSGVPVYALFSPGNSSPTLLPEILTPSVVSQAISRLPLDAATLSNPSKVYP